MSTSGQVSTGFPEKELVDQELPIRLKLNHPNGMSWRVELLEGGALRVTVVSAPFPHSTRLATHHESGNACTLALAVD